MALDKCTGVQPVGIGKAICRLMEKPYRAVISQWSLEAFFIHNFFAGLKAGIEGSVHASSQAFSKVIPQYTISSDTHPEVVTRLGTVWEGLSDTTGSFASYWDRR